MGNSNSRPRNTAFRDLIKEYEHVEDPIEQRRLVLNAIDKSTLGWAQVRAVIVAGTGFLTDSYDIFAISLVTDMLGYCYFPGGVIPQKSNISIKVATSVGTIIGQIAFGALADVVGRKRMYGYELLIIIMSTLGQCLSATATTSTVTITGLMIFWRVIMGIGIGGDYPLSSVIASEFATTKWRGAMIGAVFSMQGVGQFLVSLVSLIATKAFRTAIDNQYNTCSLNGDVASCISDPRGLAAVDRMWRIIVGVGAVPAIIALYYRLTIPETPRYTLDIGRDLEQAFADAMAWTEDTIGLANSHGLVSDEGELRRKHLNRQADRGLDRGNIPVSSWKDFWQYYGRWQTGKILIATAGSWFMVDIVYYGINLNNPVLLANLGHTSASGDTAYRIFYNDAVGNLILVCAGAIPGYICSVLLVDKLGRKAIQIGGFAILTFLFLILGFDFNHIGNAGKLTLYVLIQFFFNFGPNATTFIIPGECFPTRYRSTSHGISAAFGKIGAIISQPVFGAMFLVGSNDLFDASFDTDGVARAVKFFALFTFLGFLLSFLLRETKGKTLEELAEPESAEEKAHWAGLRRRILPSRSGKQSVSVELNNVTVTP